MILIKLGGSVVTDKSKVATARHDVIDRLAQEIAQAPGKKLIVHGGGSFGHIKAKEHNLHLGFTEDSQRDGICMVQKDMRDLNRMIEDGFHKAKVPVASIPAGAKYIASFMINLLLNNKSAYCQKSLTYNPKFFRLTTCGNTSPPFYVVKIVFVLEKQKAFKEKYTLLCRPITKTQMVTSL